MTSTQASQSSTSAFTTRVRLFWASVWILIILLAGLNLWWWYDERPLPDLALLNRWIARGWNDEAAAALKTHLRRSPHDGEALWMLARVLTARNDLAGSAQALHDVPDWWPRKKEALFREGQMLMAQGLARQAEAAWRACIGGDAMHPTPPAVFTQAVQELVQLCKWEERREDARELLWRAHQLTEPADHPTILIMSVWIGLLQNDPAEAEQRLKRFVAADPGDLQARRALALVEQALGHPDEATRQITACLKADPNGLDTWRTWLTLLLRQGDRSAIARALERAPREVESLAELWVARASVAEQAGDWSAAEQDYRRALEIAPFDEDLHYRLGMTATRSGNAARAKQHLAKRDQLHQAREALRQAYDAYLDAAAQHAGPDVMSPIFERLAQGCEALGWSREASAWRVLSGGLTHSP